MLARGLYVGVGHAEYAAVADLEDLSSALGFLRAGFRSAARAHFAGGEIEDASFITLLSHFQQRAAAGEFDVVRMSGDSEKVESHECSVVVTRNCKGDW